MAKKRGNGEGSISRRKNGGWMAQYAVYTAEGRKRKTLYAKTRQEVATKLARALSDREGGLIFDAGNLKLGDYLDHWLSDSVRDTVRQRTYERYEQMVRVHIKPTLGCVKLRALNAAQVRSLYREKLDAGLATRTVRYVHTTLNKALKDALADGLIPRNAASTVKPPKLTKKEIRPLSPEQASAFLDPARGDRFEALYVVAVTAGLREGELLARIIHESVPEKLSGVPRGEVQPHLRKQLTYPAADLYEHQSHGVQLHPPNTRRHEPPA